MPVRFTVYRSRRYVVATAGLEARLARDLNGFVAAVEERMATYPPQQPTTSGYRRTGTLMRSWSIVPAHKAGGVLLAQVGSNANIAPYARFVEGEQQTAEMRRRGWPRVMEVARELWGEARRRITRTLASVGD